MWFKSFSILDFESWPKVDFGQHSLNLHSDENFVCAVSSKNDPL